MKILIDIKHPAQLNLFKNLSQELKEEGWEVIICYLGRGKLPRIIAKEYPGFQTMQVGSSQGTKWSIIWDGNIRRTYTFHKLIVRNKFNICIACSSLPLAIACKLSNTPLLQFYDDIERKRINALNAKLSTRIFFPPVIRESRKISTFNCLKEWSYLSPDRFEPSEQSLDMYALEAHQYIFIREVSNKSFNYQNQEDALISGFSHLINPSVTVLLSLEDKSYRSAFPSNWILIEEPVENIHSIMYFSKLVLSSGDSMAREGAMLGIPSIYCGRREMKTNLFLMKYGLLKHLPGKEALSSINDISASPFDHDKQKEARKQLSHEWEDMVTYMKENIIKYKI